MSQSGSRKLLIAAVIWVVLIAIAAVVYKYVFLRGKENELIEKTQPIGTTGGTSLRERVTLAQDAFSGYCIFRSAELRAELSARGIGLDLIDDNADYSRRIETLRSGETPLAVFTIDALIKASATSGKLPGTIVMIIDETVGADAMVAYKQAVPNLDALNKPDARIVLTPDSPSEMLSRVVLAKFHLPSLPADPWIKKNGPTEVFNELRKADPKVPRAYVLWEPYVTKALEDQRVGVVMDSGSFSGYIVDVLVAERQFLLEKPQVVQAVIESYHNVAFAKRQSASGMQQLVAEDAKQLDPKNPLSAQQSQRLVKGIRWKTTEENYAHLGVYQGASAQGLRHVEDMIREITAVLLKTNAIAADPTGGDPKKLYADQVLLKMHRENFHPNKAGGAAAGGGITVAKELPPLTDEQWGQLKPLGRMQVEPLVFARASDRLLEQSDFILENVVDLMGRFPQSYLLVQGHARPEGDKEANRILAEKRAKAAAEYLTLHGVAAHRVRAIAGEMNLAGGEAQSVTFVLKQMPY